MSRLPSTPMGIKRYSRQQTRQMERLQQSSAFNLSGTSVVAEDVVEVDGTLNVVGALVVDGTETVNGPLAVTGVADISGTTHIGGALNVDATANFDGNTTIGGTLDTTGNTTIGGTLGVTGPTTLGGATTVSGNTSVSGSLGVTGPMTVGGTLGVTGTTTLSAPTTVSGSLGVSGPMTVTGTLSLPAGIIDNAALANPVVSQSVYGTLSNFNLAAHTFSTPLPVIKTVTITVPAGFTAANVSVISRVFAYNNNTTGGADGAGSDYFAAQTGIAGSLDFALGVFVNGNGASAVAISPFATTLTGLTPGSTFTITIGACSGYLAWTQTGNVATVSGNILWFR